MSDYESSVELTSSEIALEEFFKRSTIWKDIANLLNEGLADALAEMIDPNLREPGVDVVRGRIMQLQYVLNLPETMKELKEQQAEDAMLSEEVENG
jgi:hypothetical protein